MHPSIEPRLALLSSLIAACVALSACGGAHSPSTESAGDVAPSQDVQTKGQDVADAPAADEVPAVAAAPEEANTAAPAPDPVAQPVAVAPATESMAMPLAVVASASANVPAGTGYFVDSINGSDSNLGNSIDKPFKKLARLAGVRINAGEGVYLKCGSTWRESLTVGTNAMIANIANGAVIAGYGDCSTKKATISGANDFSGSWSKSGNVWSRGVPAGTPKINRLFVNGTSQWTARWPNTGGIGREWAISSSTSPISKTVLNPASSVLPELTGKDLSGATIHIRSEPFTVDKQTVSGLVSGALVLAAATHYSLEAGDGYAISDKAWMLDAPGEFFHDTVNNRLYLYPSDANAQSNLNGPLVEGSVRDLPLKVADHSNIAVSNVTLTMARSNGVAFYSAPGAKLSDSESSHNGGAGVFSTVSSLPTGMYSISVLNSKITDNWVIGVDGANAPNMLVKGNTVRDTGTIGYSGWSDAAIKAGKGSVVDGNVVSRSSAAAIAISGVGGTQAINNLISGYCLRLTDCGAIYSAGATTLVDQRSVISGNQILGATANTEGAMSGAPDLVVGIYLDDYSKGAAVSNNMILGAPTGIYVHNGSNHSITNNKFWLTTTVGLSLSMDRTDANYMTGNVVSGNQFVPTTAVTGSYPNLPFGASSLAISYQDRLSGTALLTSGSNLFANNNIVPVFGASVKVAAAGSLTLTTQGWRNLNPQEGTAAPPVTYQPYIATTGPELMVDGEFNGGFTNWRTWLQTGGTGGGAALVSGISGCSGQCMRFTAGKTGDLLISSGFSLQAGVPHLIKYTAALGGTGTVGGPYITRNVSPYDYLISGGVASLSPLSGVSGDIVRYEGIFKPSTTAVGRLNLTTSVGMPVAYDSVSVKAITGYSTPTMAELVAAAYAPAANAVTVTCASLGWTDGCTAVDTAGASLTFPTTVAAGTNRMFLRTGTVWKR